MFVSYARQKTRALYFAFSARDAPAPSLLQTAIKHSTSVNSLCTLASMICRKPASINTHKSGYLFSMDPARVWVAVFKNVNLVHVISLEKNYAKESVNVVIENIASSPQDEYFLPFTADQMSRLGGLEVKDRKDADAGPFETLAVEFDPSR